MPTDELFKKAQALKSMGLSTYEIADTLKVQPDTVVWLLLRAKERATKPAPFDIFVDWSSIGAHGKRLSSVGAALADLILEGVALRRFDDPDVIAAMEGSGMVLGSAVAKELSKPFAAVRPQRLGVRKVTGLINPSFHSVRGRKVLIVDAVVRAGETHKAAVETLRNAKAKPVGIVVLVNKSGKSRIDGTPLRALIEIQSVRAS